MSGTACGFYCDRPECIRAQRDYLRDMVNDPEVMAGHGETTWSCPHAEGADLAESAAGAPGDAQAPDPP